MSSKSTYRKRDAQAPPNLGPRFIDLKRIANGSYGVVYTAKDFLNNNRECVVKVEERFAMCKSLKNEATFLEHLRRKRMDGVPRIICHDVTDSVRYVAMECLGPSLFDLVDFCGGRVSAMTALKIGS